MNRNMWAILFALITCPLVSFAQEEKGIDKNLENISGQYAECAAYYELVYHAMNASKGKETADAYKQLEDNAMFYSLLLANERRSKDLAVKVTYSRIDMHMKIMKQEIDNRNENISILINKHHFGCEEAIKNPPNEVLDILKTKLNETANQTK